MKLKPSEVLLVEGGLGRCHYVSAVFTDTDAANAYLAVEHGEAVIATFGGMILIARIDDLGIELPPHSP